MDDKLTSETHAAEASVLGFLYQSFYALRTLVLLTTDDAAVSVERLDDIELKADGQTLLFQLKHSISAKPPAITLKSRSLWRTMKVWIDALATLTLAETKLHLVAVGAISTDSPLVVLTDDDADRADLVAAMTEEANRVLEAREAADKAGTKPLPYGDRVDGCRAFLALPQVDRLNLLRRTMIRPNSPTVAEIEAEIAGYFHLVLPEFRAAVAKRLVEWWDRQVVYSLCGERERVITRAELQSQIMSIVADLEQDKLVPEFETLGPPDDYQPDGMLARQIELVKGKSFDLKRAIREEWKAREQRGRWTAGNPAMKAKITAYDYVLREHWSDRYDEMLDACSDLDDEGKCASGLGLLRWTHNEAPRTVQPITVGWGAPYYVRGSYQVLAINLKVGWHPNYPTILGGAE
uniref:ABC-three component systems C-terminal domain-containing protein n=1 Tax=Cereibacter sphaeroides (strain ATCC 17025 / ATH 2.4.3) TaxID=349102 RepID=A4WQP9_CERS5